MKLLEDFFPACSIILSLGFCSPDILAFQNPKETRVIKIGMLIADNNSLSAKNGAEMAIKEANGAGGFNGRPFQQVVRTMEGPWGTGSTQAVNLIFEEEVWAILGSHNGRNTHIVEQVVTKARIVFLSAWASDPTLSQAFVPWYFSCVPNDNQQADALIEEIYYKRKLSKVAILSDSIYDSKIAIKSLMKKIKAAGKEDPLNLYYDTTSQDFNKLLHQINTKNVDCIVLAGQPPVSIKIIQQMRIKKMNQPVFGSLSTMNGKELSDQELRISTGIIFVASGYWLRPKGLVFKQEYQRIYGPLPDEVAAYAFDGMNIIIDAIRNAGVDRDNIQKSMVKINNEGITGPIRFDEKGNRMGAASLFEIKNGITIAVGEK